MKKVYRLQIDATHNEIQRHLCVLYEDAEYAVKILNKITRKFRKEWNISTENQWNIREDETVPRFNYRKNDGKSWYYYDATIYEELMLDKNDTIEYMCGEVFADNGNPNIMGINVTPAIRSDGETIRIADIIDIGKGQRAKTSFDNGVTVVGEDIAEIYYETRRKIITNER